MKNTFDLDYKMNLTYAQLAEHRRQKRVADLEDKTGKKLSDLNAGGCLGPLLFTWTLSNEKWTTQCHRVSQHSVV